MASLTPPPSATADHDGQKMMESIIRSLAQYSVESAVKGISAILKQNDDLLEKTASLEEDLKASVKNSVLIATQLQTAEAQQDKKQDALNRLEQERANSEAKLKRAHDQVAKLTSEITATKEEITKTFKSKEDTEQQLEKKTQENSSQKAQLRQSEKSLQEIQETLNGLQRRYDTDHAELVSLRSKAVSLQEVPKSATPALIERIRSIFEKAHGLVYRFFGQSDLNANVFNGEKWKSLEGDERLAGIPLVATNSAVAARMRVASVLRILASSTLEHITQPVYLPEYGTQISTVIDQLYHSDAEYAHWFRSVLLNIEPETQKENAGKRIEAVVKEVIHSVGFLLEPAGTDKDFHVALQHWCDETTQTWRDLQHLTCAFQYLFEPHPRYVDPNEWAPLPESPRLLRKAGVVKEANGASPSSGGSGKTTTSSAAQTRDSTAPADIAAQIWPLVLVVGKKGEIEVFRRGYMLTEAHVGAALDERERERERKRATSRSPDQNHSRLKRKDRRIISSSNASTEGFLKIGG